MAAPAEVTLKSLTGEYIMNKKLSDDADAILALQGISWLVRRAISWATITLTVKEYVAEDGLTHIDIEQNGSGGIKGTPELRTLDWTKRSHHDTTFGDLEGQSRWVKLEGLDSAKGGPLDSWLAEGWLVEDGVGPDGETHVQSYVVNAEKGWVAEQIWGFAEIEGGRYYARRVVVEKGGKVLKVRLVYDWQVPK